MHIKRPIAAHSRPMELAYVPKDIGLLRKKELLPTRTAIGRQAVREQIDELDP
jgi:hypothetical protein